MERIKHYPQRRMFFKALALLGGTLALARPAGKNAAAAPLREITKSGQSGYRLTPHIRKYYESAAK